MNLKDYELIPIFNDYYSYLVIGLNKEKNIYELFKSLHNSGDLDEIEMGRVLFDLVLIEGPNSDMRFISCDIFEGELEPKTIAKRYCMFSDARLTTAKYFISNPSIIDNSNLSTTVKDLLKEGRLL